MCYYSLGYLILDGICINYYKELSEGKFIYNIHHLIFILSWTIYSENRYLSSRILICEVSTIFLDLRYLSKYYWPKYHTTLSLATMSTFFVVRIWNNFNICNMNHPFIDKYYYLFYPYFGLQLYWFSLMNIKAYKTLLGKED